MTIRRFMGIYRTEYSVMSTKRRKIRNTRLWYIHLFRNAVDALDTKDPSRIKLVHDSFNQAIEKLYENHKQPRTAVHVGKTDNLVELVTEWCEEWYQFARPLLSWKD